MMVQSSKDVIVVVVDIGRSGLLGGDMNVNSDDKDVVNDDSDDANELELLIVDQSEANLTY